ncbi:hypothetical protein [Paraburkholderia sp. MM6662-R1]|uniref:hypothetical protein n=1 Tax=Paraburkholderia sp. MM6662-R1 TaxID=2991066 RepID=UPI003D2037FC
MNMDDETLLRTAWAFVMTLCDRGYTAAQIKSAFTPELVDAYIAIDEKRHSNDD